MPGNAVRPTDRQSGRGGPGTESGAIWEMEDEELLTAIKWQIGELLSRRSSEVA